MLFSPAEQAVRASKGLPKKKYKSSIVYDDYEIKARRAALRDRDFRYDDNPFRVEVYNMLIAKGYNSQDPVIIAKLNEELNRDMEEYERIENLKQERQEEKNRILKEIKRDEEEEISKLRHMKIQNHINYMKYVNQQRENDIIRIQQSKLQLKMNMKLENQQREKDRIRIKQSKLQLKMIKEQQEQKDRNELLGYWIRLNYFSKYKAPFRLVLMNPTNVPLTPVQKAHRAKMRESYRKYPYSAVDKEFERALLEDQSKLQSESESESESVLIIQNNIKLLYDKLNR